MRTKNDIIASAFHWDFMILNFFGIPNMENQNVNGTSIYFIKNIQFLLQHLQGFNFFFLFVFCVCKSILKHLLLDLMLSQCCNLS